MSWLKKLFPSKVDTAGKSKKGVPEGLWTKCGDCQAILYRAELQRHLGVCPKCHHHMNLTAAERLDTFLDPSAQVPIGLDIEPVDWLKFKDSKKYKDRLVAAQKKTGSKDALSAARGQLLGLPVVVAAFDFSFIGGSMGSAVGEVFVSAVNVCIERHLPFICFSASGGARMQEGIVSLMQMAKTSAVLGKLAQARLPYISVLTNPTMGGVSASLAMLGDIIITEPKALIGFAGPRVIKETVRETLPEGFQRSEFLLKHGAVDMIVERKHLRNRIGGLIAKLTHQTFIPEAETLALPAPETEVIES